MRRFLPTRWLRAFADPVRALDAAFLTGPVDFWFVKGAVREFFTAPFPRPPGDGIISR